MRALAAFVSLAAALCCLWLAFAPRTNPLVQTAESYQRDIAVASGATYISLRAINAALSFAQEVEVGGSIGVTGNVQPLKWLEPVDDTVERISAMVFSVAVLTGVLSISLAPVAAVGFLLLAISFAVRCTCEVAPGGWHHASPRLHRAYDGCATLGFAFAIGLPLAYALGVWGGDVLTAVQAADASATVDRIADEARALIGAGGDERGWRETADAYRRAATMFWDNADALLDASLTLIGIFILRMVVLPLVLLLALVAVSRRMLRG